MVEVPENFVPLHESNYSSDILSEMSQFQKDGTFTDFKIQVKDKVIACHKIVLCAACPYFSAMINSG